MAGQPPFQPTPENRELVRMLSAMGTKREDICKLIKGRSGKPIDGNTLDKYFHEELEEGWVRANAQVAKTLFNAATNQAGGSASVTAAIFWLKTRAGWREIDRHEITGANGSPLASIVVPANAATIDEIRQELQRGDW